MILFVPRFRPMCDITRRMWLDLCCLLRRSYTYHQRLRNSRNSSRSTGISTNTTYFAPRSVTYIVYFTLNMEVHTLRDKPPPSLHLPGRLGPSYYFSRCCFAPLDAPGRLPHRGIPIKQGPHCSLPHFAEPPTPNCLLVSRVENSPHYFVSPRFLLVFYFAIPAPPGTVWRVAVTVLQQSCCALSPFTQPHTVLLCVCVCGSLCTRYVCVECAPYEMNIQQQSSVLALAFVVATYGACVCVFLCD